jgi:hypothetical protein
MQMRRKNRIKLLQQIRILASIKQKRRQKRHSRVIKSPTQMAVLIPRAPRKFRRYKNINNQNFYGDKLNKEATLRASYVDKYLPENLKYITEVKNSPFNLSSIRKEKYNTGGRIEIPSYFSILDNPNESYTALRQLIAALLLENNTQVILNYENCKNIELSTQVLLDIILIEFVSFKKKCTSIHRQKRKLFPRIGHENLNDPNLQKFIFSVGSPVNLGIKQMDFPDTVKYKLRVHNNRKEKDENRRMAQKELDVSEMADYVIDSLQKMNKRLTPEKRDDLCTVIGEILINAEEHSTTQHRFSIGYFKEEMKDGNHYGLFRLVILNFGKTIYEKFKSEDCPNQDIVGRMNDLSKKYIKKLWFLPGKFEEESLWTLYALQEGITSVSQDSYKRGNGSIRFIDSFFNIKGSQQTDALSRMSIVSGKTRIIFNGKYCITDKTNSNGETFKVMTFNDSGNIEDKPDTDCVICSENYFPGTMISAKLLLNDDDVTQIKNENI